MPNRPVTLVMFVMVLSLLPSGCKPAESAPVIPSIEKKSVIILCTGNSCRSQMAEAFWKKYAGDKWDVVSAGTHPKPEVYPLAVKSMAEKGIDISGSRTKGPEQYLGRHFDLVITVCDNAEKECPTFRNAKQHLHWPFDDPPKAAGDDEAKMKVCRRVRDEIEAKIKDYLAAPASAAARVGGDSI